MINKILKVFLVLSLLMSFAGCATQPAETEQKGEDTTNEVRSKQNYKITVISEGGMPFSRVPVTVYTNSDREELVWRAVSSEDGVIEFMAYPSSDYVAVVEDIPDGYDNKEYYPVVSDVTVITPEILLEEKEDLTGISYDLGDIFHDFTFCDAQGVEYQLSELLKTKKAVMLNFWYLNCMPCKMEFPYLEEAYRQYEDKIEILAINPIDGNNETIAAFAEELDLTFPIGKGDSVWESVMKLNSYPTTVIIDRYGTISMIHNGYITETEIFTDVFEYFTADDYVQSVVKNIENINGNKG